MFKNYLEKEANRDKLPYRRTANVLIFDKDKVIAQDKGSFIKLPGGGIDKGETPERAAEREALEEIGVKLKDIKQVGSHRAIWPESFSRVGPKQAKRYKQFKGEEVVLLTALLASMGKATNIDNDAWSGNINMKHTDLINKLQTKRAQRGRAKQRDLMLNSVKDHYDV